MAWETENTTMNRNHTLLTEGGGEMAKFSLSVLALTIIVSFSTGTLVRAQEGAPATPAAPAAPAATAPAPAEPEKKMDGEKEKKGKKGKKGGKGKKKDKKNG